MLSATRTGGRKCITSFRATSSMAQGHWVKTVVKLSHLLALGLALLFGTGSNAQDPISATNGFVPSTAANRSVKRGVEVQIKDLNPFTHFALIPATSNAQTIKLERVKATRVYTTLKSTMDPGYCGDLQFRDPGGSMYCPYTGTRSDSAARPSIVKVFFLRLLPNGRLSALPTAACTTPDRAPTRRRTSR